MTRAEQLALSQHAVKQSRGPRVGDTCVTREPRREGLLTHRRLGRGFWVGAGGPRLLDGEPGPLGAPLGTELQPRCGRSANPGAPKQGRPTGLGGDEAPRLCTPRAVGKRQQPRAPGHAVCAQGGGGWAVFFLPDFLNLGFFIKNIF